MFTKLAMKSLLDRKGSVLLSLLAMTVSIFVLLGVEHIRHQAKESFAKTVSGVDLIVGARSGSLNLLLYSVFRIGSATNNMSWESYQRFANHKNVKWAIPLSLGDSHKGYRVLGTTADYFEHFSYGQKHRLAFAAGEPFSETLDVVLGADVARSLNYQLGDKVVLAHGIAATSFSMHDDKPFTVTGILAPTGTPVDRTLHVSLRGIEAIHVDWQQGVKNPYRSVSVEQLAEMDLTPKSITAMMVGLNARLATFNVQREINTYAGEPLMAILPGVALSELWQIMDVLEKTLLLVSVLVFLSACLGVCAMLLCSLRERRREMHLLRIIGAPPRYMFVLLQLEALLITVFSIIFGAGLLLGVLHLAQTTLVTQFGLHIEGNIFGPSTFWLMGSVVVASAIMAAIPAVSGYRQARVVHE
jgi:putative ABC transport system permease protein